MNQTYRYFPVNDAQRSWGLYATCVGHGRTMPGDEFPSPNHPDEYFFSWEMGRILNEWQIIMVEEGHGSVEFRHRRSTVREGSLIVLPPGCWHRYRPNPQTGWTTLWIGFGGDLADRLVGGAGFDRQGDIRNLAGEHVFHQLFAKTVTDVLERGHDNVYSTAAGIPSLIAALMEGSPSNLADHSSHAELIHRAQAFIAEHAAEVVDFMALADSLGVRYRTLRYLFAKETGLSLLQYKLGIRLARAKNLLRSTDMPIADMAKALGFNSAWYFSRFFKDAAKMTPIKYRNARSKAHPAIPSATIGNGDTRRSASRPLGEKRQG